MTIDEYYAEEIGPYARALQPLSAQLTQQALQLWAHSEAPLAQRLSPWTFRLGKGGPRIDRQSGQSVYFPEVSLYRHVADVGFLASYLFYWAWQSGILPLAADEDVTPYVAVVLVMALCHDADKYEGTGRSISPSVAQVQQVWDDLGGIGWISPTLWPNFSPATLHAAVSLVENRGQSQALLGPALPVMIQRLAHMVGQADNFMSKTAVADPDAVMDAWVVTYNDKLPDWHDLYGVPATPLSLVQFHDEPAVLQHILEVIRAGEAFYPLVVMREGHTLSLTLPDDWPLEEFLTYLDRYAFQTRKNPRMIRNRTNGRLTLADCENPGDLDTLVAHYPVTVQDVLTVKATTLPLIAPYLAFWAAASEGLYETHWQDPGTRKLLTPLTPTGEMSLAYQRALKVALVLGESAGDREARLHRALDEPCPGLPATVRDTLLPMIDALDQLDGLSLRTVVALQAALMVEEEAFAGFLDWVHGPFPSRDASGEGAHAVADRLRAQSGLQGNATTPPLTPYELSREQSGMCLLCGQPAETEIKTGTMELVGVKRSAFNNRIGHQKSLWSQSEANYICSGCLYAQELLGHMAQSMQVRVQKAPLLVALPVRALWHTPGDAVPQALRSFDAVAFKENRWTKVLPWQADQGLTFPLGFEEKPDRDIADSGRNDDVLSQVWRLSLYAAMSGEPVHVFVSAQRTLPTAFYYEPLPAWLWWLLGDLHRSGDTEGVSRQDLPQWITRLEILRQLSQMNGSREAMIDLPHFGWWSGAWLVGRAEAGSSPVSQQMLNQLKEWYPMEDYSALLNQAAHGVTDIQRLSYDATRSQVNRIFRRVLDEYQALHGQKGVTRDFMLEAIAGLVYQDLDRSEDRVDDRRVRQTVDVCLRIVEQADQDDHLSSKMVKYLLAAFEMTVRETVRARIAAHQAARATAE